MTLSEIAAALVDGCRKNLTLDNLKKLYAPDAVSVEATDSGNGREAKGLDAIRGKHEWWEDSFTVHSAEVEGPFLHGDDSFAVIFRIDSTMKATGERSQMAEVGIYTVKDGKITREEFYYGS